MRASLAALSAVCLVGCRHAPEAIPGTTAAFQGGSDMWDTPFPGVHRQGPDGRIPLFEFPNPQAKPWVDSVVDLAHDRFAEGSTTGPVTFAFDGDLDPASLPDPLGSLEDDSPVMIYDLDAR